MPSTIITKNGSGAPLAADLVAGELAVDLTNGRLYTEDSGGSVIEIGLNPSGNVDVTGTVTADGLTVDGTGSVTQSSNAATALMTFTNANAGASARSAISFASDTGSSVVGTVSSGWTVDALSANETFLYGSNGVSLFAPASQDVRILAGGSEKLVVKSSGNVGIGVVPDSNSKLHVLDDTSSLDDYVVHIESYTPAIVFHDISATSTDFAIQADDSALMFRYGDASTGTQLASEAMRIDSSGNVGIGTSSIISGARLDVRGANANDLSSLDAQVLTVQDTTSYAANVGGGIAFGYKFNSSGDSIQRGAVIKAVKENATDGNYSTSMAFATVANGGQTTEKMRIDSSGNLLVGTTDTAAFDGTRGILIGGANSALAFSTTGNNQMLIYSTTNGLQFYDSTNNAQRMLLDNSGNLLVGTETAFGTTGTTINQAGLIYSSADGDRSGQFDRTTNDGEIVRFTRAGSTVGSIGTANIDSITIGNSTGNLILYAGTVAPASTSAGGASDGVVDLGTSARRFKDLYLSGGVNQSTVLVSALPAAASSTGYRFMVSDSTVAASGNFGATVAGSGSNVVPVFSDGTNWLIG